MFWDTSKKLPRMLSSCKSVIRLIAIYFGRYTEAVCSACGVFTQNDASSHCLLSCHVYIRLASYDDETFMSVLLSNFDLICDILDAKYKLDLYCYLARFIHIQRLTCDGIA